MMDYRHSAYNIRTGEIINAPSGNTLKRVVARTQHIDKYMFGVCGQWRFSHDYGKKWEVYGLPTQ